MRWTQSRSLAGTCCSGRDKLRLAPRSWCSECARRRSLRSFARPFFSSLGGAPNARLKGRMSSAPTSEEIARDATWLAQALDPSAGNARLIAMDRESYRAASFLDDRILQQPVDAQVMSWTVIEEAITDELRSDARWIFHIGHVGSTLLSRLLGELTGVLAIREPRLLRDLALSPPAVSEGYIRPVARLMSRTFADDDLACVKAT